MSGVHAPDGDVAAVVTEAMEWLEAGPGGDDPAAHCPLRAAVDTLCRYMAAQEKLECSKDALKTLRVHHTGEHESGCGSHSGASVVGTASERLASERDVRGRRRKCVRAVGLGGAVNECSRKPSSMCVVKILL